MSRNSLRFLASCVALVCLSDSAAADVSVVSVQGTLSLLIDGAPPHALAAGDALPAGAVIATGADSRATIDYGVLSLARLGAGGRLVVPDISASGPLRVKLLAGEIYIFNRRPASSVALDAPGGSAVLEGTELHVLIESDRATIFTLFDGSLRLGSVEESLLLAPGEEGRLEAGRAPVRQSGVEISRRIQWALYYPAVLVDGDLPRGIGDDPTLAAALAAYRAGNPVAALEKLPAQRGATPVAAAFEAALLLAAGRVDQAQLLLSGPARGLRVESTIDAAAQATLDALAASLEGHIATVNQRGTTTAAAAAPRVPQTATEWLVESYRQQTAGDLVGALASAKKATVLAPSSTYAWTRLAELEFSFGRIPEARAALAIGLRLGPQNAQAVALDGFLRAAENDFDGAIVRFDEALKLDGGLGNAWLGRGLARIAKGDRERGLDDLRTAAAQEPNRSILRSYFGKALTDAGLDEKAGDELRLARTLDANDPTPWLYAALRDRRNRSLNTAARDVLESIARNDNRAVFRSRFLLDQDAAVRGSNLAGLFQEAGLEALAIGEAGRAVEVDHLSASANRFLAGAYDARRDPSLYSKRYESAWFDTLLLANILAPVGSGGLSPIVSQGEYSRLFSSDVVQGSLDATYTDFRDMHAVGSLGGSHRSFAWSIDVDHFKYDGPLANDDFDRTEIYASGKWAATDRDTLYALVRFKDARAGDVRPLRAGEPRLENYRTREKQEPLAFAAWRHAWSPEQQTVVFVSRAPSTKTTTDSGPQTEIQVLDFEGQLDRLPGSTGYWLAYPTAALTQREGVSIRSIEVRHTLRAGTAWLTGGARLLSGHSDSVADLDFESVFFDTLFGTRRHEAVRADVDRRVGYFTASIPLSAGGSFTAGLTHDDVTFPKNPSTYPFITDTRSRSVWGPNAGVILSPARDWRLRAAFSRTLGGFDIDESIRIEPVHVVGFVKPSRALIPEGLEGSRPGALMDAANLAIEWRPSKNTSVEASAHRFESDAIADVKAFTYQRILSPDGESVLSETLAPTFYQRAFDFCETGAGLRVDQLFGDRWNGGLDLDWQRARLDSTFPGWATSWRPAAAKPDRVNTGDMFRATARVGWQSARGPFVRAQASWWNQRCTLPVPAPRDEIFADLEVGWRLARERGSFSIALLNAANAGTSFDPINTVILPAPRRTVAANVHVRF